MSSVEEEESFIDMDEITPGVWLGSETVELQAAASQLVEKKITHIIQLREPDAFAVRPHMGIHYMNICIEDDDTENIYQYFWPCILHIRQVLQSGSSILIHCHAGISRSASIVVAYLMYANRRSTDDDDRSVDEIIRKISVKRTIDPNPGFHTQLETFSKHCQTISHLPSVLDSVADQVMSFLL